MSDGYHRFEETGNVVAWESLVISVRSADCVTSNICPICWQNIYTDACYGLPCKHSFHQNCLAAWKRCQSAACCPVCNSSLDVTV